MLSIRRITDALPVETPTFPVTPTDFVNVAFTPALLLPIPLDASLTTHKFFHPECESGFRDYFAEMERWEDEDTITFVDHFHTWDEVKAFLIKNAFPDPRDVKMAAFYKEEPPPLALHIGYVLGWLSALGLTNRPLALQGAALLAQLAAILQPPTQQPETLLSAYAVPFLSPSQEGSGTPSSPSTNTRRVGGDGFPLDM